mmetsp:Transcript_2742/g.17098  ORF Transcript_2742/g.17098 Transcript_2742/m.17098 type:complete len:107 (+) Transcript_2742:1123-1443(+)
MRAEVDDVSEAVVDKISDIGKRVAHVDLSDAAVAHRVLVGIEYDWDDVQQCKSAFLWVEACRERCCDEKGVAPALVHNHEHWKGPCLDAGRNQTASNVRLQCGGGR